VHTKRRSHFHNWSRITLCPKTHRLNSWLYNNLYYTHYKIRRAYRYEIQGLHIPFNFMNIPMTVQNWLLVTWLMVATVILYEKGPNYTRRLWHLWKVHTWSVEHVFFVKRSNALIIAVFASNPHYYLLNVMKLDAIPLRLVGIIWHYSWTQYVWCGTTLMSRQSIAITMFGRAPGGFVSRFGPIFTVGLQSWPICSSWLAIMED
jgi:hypothetical protein